MQVVVRRTGLTSHVIRVWERRYQAVVPHRTDTNRRLYTDADIERLKLLRQATKSGHSIGHIAQMPTADLEELLRADEAIQPEPVEFRHPATPGTESGIYVERSLTAVQALNAAALEEELAQASVALSQIKLLEEVIGPLLLQIGELWQDGSLRIAEEHLATAVVRTFVGNMQSTSRVPSTSPGFIATTPTGQLHDIGALLVATTAATMGWRATFLGPNLPAEEIAGAARRNQARVVSLSIIAPSDDPHLGPELVKLGRYLDEDTILILGGRAAPAYMPFLDPARTVYLETLRSLQKHLSSTWSPLPYQ